MNNFFIYKNPLITLGMYAYFITRKMNSLLLIIYILCNTFGNNFNLKTKYIIDITPIT